MSSNIQRKKRQEKQHKYKKIQVSQSSSMTKREKKKDKKKQKEQDKKREELNQQVPNKKKEQILQTLKNARERAIVASKIIQMITNENQKNYEALAAKIKKMKASDFGQINKENFDIVLQLFNNGVTLLSCFIRQERITKSLNTNSRFIFHPTWMGTAQIYKFINQCPQNPTMLIRGSTGIGKTVSMISYCLLMENVFKYSLLESKEKIEEMVEKKLIVKPLKVMYWSINQVENSQSIIKSFIIQCPEFEEYLKSKEQDWNSLNQQKFFQKLGWYYFSKQKQTLVIIDQINFLVQFCRKINQNQRLLNQKYKQIQKLKLKLKSRSKQNYQESKLTLLELQSTQIYSKLLQEKRKFLKLNSFRKHIHNLGTYKIYNSSVNIQTQLLNNPEQRHQITLNFSTQNRVSQVEINYRRMVEQEKGRIQLTEYILFQFAKRGKKCTEEEINEIKALFQKIQVSLLTPQTICNEISKSQQNNQNLPNFPKFIQKMNISQNLILQKIKSDSKKFFVKISTENDGIAFRSNIFQIYKNAYKDMLNNKNKKVVINLSRFQYEMEKYEKLIDKNLFFKNNDNYEFIYSNNFFYQLTISNFIDSYIYLLKQSMKIWNISKTSPSVFGSIFQYCLLEAIILKRKFIFSYIDSSTNTRQNYLIKNVGKFQQFNSNNQNQILFVILCDPDSLPRDLKDYNFTLGDIKSIDLSQFNKEHSTKLELLIKSFSEVKIK